MLKPSANRSRSCFCSNGDLSVLPGGCSSRCTALAWRGPNTATWVCEAMRSVHPVRDNGLAVVHEIE